MDDIVAQQGIVIQNLPWHQCKLHCLQTSACQSVNQNCTDNICSYFPASGKKKRKPPNGVDFAPFRERKSKECIKWILKEDVCLLEENRSVSEDNMRFTTRTQNDGTNWLGHNLYWLCSGKDEVGKLTSQRGNSFSHPDKKNATATLSYSHGKWTFWLI